MRKVYSLVLAFALLCTASVRADSEAIVRLLDALSTPAAQLILKGTPEGENLATRVLGRRLQTEEDTRLLAEKILGAKDGQSFQENLFQRMRMIDSESRTTEGAIDSERVELFASKHLKLSPKRWFARSGDLEGLSFVEAGSEPRGYSALKSRFVSDAPSAEPLPSTQASARISKNFRFSKNVRYLLASTIQGQAIVETLQSSASYRTTLSVETALSHLSAPRSRGMALDLDYRLGILMDQVSWISADESEAGLHQQLDELAARFLQLAPALTSDLPLFEPIRGSVRGPKSGTSLYFEF